MPRLDAGADHVCIGTDSPFDMADNDPRETVSSIPRLTDEERDQDGERRRHQYLRGEIGLRDVVVRLQFDVRLVNRGNRLGLPDGTLRIGFVHYNTADEVDRLLAGLAELV